MRFNFARLGAEQRSSQWNIRQSQYEVFLQNEEVSGFLLFYRPHIKYIDPMKPAKTFTISAEKVVAVYTVSSTQVHV